MLEIFAEIGSALLSMHVRLCTYTSLFINKSIAYTHTTIA